MSHKVSLASFEAGALPPRIVNEGQPRMSLHSNRHRIGIIGLGYVGLPTAIDLARSENNTVVGFDISAKRLDMIHENRVDLSPDRRRLIDGLLSSGDLELSSDPAVLHEVETVIVCVPTPVDEHRTPDLRALRSARDAVVASVRPGQTIIVTSTTYVGCTKEMFVEPLQRLGFTVGEDVYVAYSPERIDPGVTGHDPRLTPRVLGGFTNECATHAATVLGETSLTLHHVSSLEAAETTKLLENTFRAVNISFVNEFSDMAIEYGLDISEIIGAAASKPYGFMKFTPGPGVGGHCIPCDPEYLLWGMKKKRLQAPIVEATMNSISARPLRIVRMIRDALNDSGTPIAKAHVHVAGVAFKPNVSDVRESPALVIMGELASQGCTVTYSDAHVETVTVDGLTFEKSPSEVAAEADVILVHTLHEGETHEDWRKFSRPVVDALFSTTSPLISHAI